MSFLKADLPDDIGELKDIIIRQNSFIRELKRMLFGSKSEKRKSPPHESKDSLFNEAEKTVAEEKKETKVIVKSYKRSRKRGRKPIPEHLPRKEIIHDLPEHEKTCTCGAKLVKIGEDILEELEYIPAKVLVLRHITNKYACRSCEGTSNETKPAVHTNRPKRLLPGSICSEKLLAYIVTSKYKDGLPLYRLEKILKRLNVDVGRTSMASWIINAYKNMQDLAELSRKEVVSTKTISMDETVLQVLQEPGRSAESKSYMWCFRNYKKNPTICYHYAPSRGSPVVEKLAAGFTGTLLSDGLSVYGVAARKLGYTWAACHVHCRRNFEKASKDGEAEADRILAIYAKLFEIEEYAKQKKLSEKEIYELRQHKSKPIVDELFALFHEKAVQTFGATTLGKAYRYALKLETQLRVFLDDPSVPIDNNRTENDIRPFVVGRKNWLFSASVPGAEASAFFYSLITTAEANGHDPYQYLIYLFSKYPYAEDEQAKRALLPSILKPEDIPDPETIN